MCLEEPVADGDDLADRPRPPHAAYGVSSPPAGAPQWPVWPISKRAYGPEHQAGVLPDPAEHAGYAARLFSTARLLVGGGRRDLQSPDQQVASIGGHNRNHDFMWSGIRQPPGLKTVDAPLTHGVTRRG